MACFEDASTCANCTPLAISIDGSTNILTITRKDQSAITVDLSPVLCNQCISSFNGSSIVFDDASTLDLTTLLDNLSLSFDSGDHITPGGTPIVTTQGDTVYIGSSDGSITVSVDAVNNDVDIILAAGSISGDAGNIISYSSGLFASETDSTLVDNTDLTFTYTDESGISTIFDAQTLVGVSDGDTIDFSISGTGRPGATYDITGEVILSADLDNLLGTSGVDAALTATLTVTPTDTDSIDLTISGAGTVADPLLIQADLELDTVTGGGDNIAVITAGEGLYVPPVAETFTELSDDATPQLGGDLDVNGNDIISAAAGDINITPNTTGRTNITNLTIEEDASGGDKFIEFNQTTNDLILDVTDQSLGVRTLTIPDLLGNDADVVTTNTAQTLTNKTIGDSNIINAQDDAFAIQDAASSTKQILFNAAGTVATSTTLASSQTVNRVLTLPDADDTLVGRDTTDTLTNKSLTSPTITGTPDATGSTWTDLGTVTTADIDGGTIDAAVIGGGTAAAGTFSTLSVEADSIILDSDDGGGFTTTLTQTATAARVINLPDLDGTLMANLVEDTTPQLGGDLDLNGNGINDTNGNEILGFTATGSAVNNVLIQNAATGNTPAIKTEGDDADIGLTIETKGAGILRVDNTIAVTGAEEVSAGAISLTEIATYFDTAGAETSTLAAGTAGQIKTLAMTTDLGDMVVTVTNPAWGGGGTITFANVGEGCTLQYINAKWCCVGNNGAVFA